MTFARGEWVYVDPGAGGAPRELLGLAGRVVEVTDARVTVAFGRDERERVAELEATFLLPDRRRRNRPPAKWPAGSFAQPV